jgi:hypothetical protein
MGCPGGAMISKDTFPLPLLSAPWNVPSQADAPEAKAASRPMVAAKVAKLILNLFDLTDRPSA